MNTKFKSVILAALLILGVAQTSHAILTAVGPADPGNGFPVWYQDSNNTALVPCLSGTVSPNVAPAVPFPGTPAPLPFPNFVAPTTAATIMCVVLPESDALHDFRSLPAVFPTNFPIEFFYFIADVDKLSAPAYLKTARFAVEGSFANLPTFPVDGLQTVFTRIRFSLTPPLAGATYTITHPWGTTTVGPANLAGGLYKFTEDIPLGIALNFTGALNGNVGPFLKWDTGFPIVIGTEQFIGDPNIPHTVTGSPLGQNFVRIDGPNAGGTGINTWQGNLFTVAGKLFNGALPTPLTVERASYSRDALGAGQVDVFAHSGVAAFVDAQAVADPLTPTLPTELVGPHALITDHLGSFFVHVPVANLASLPASVNVTSVLAGAASTTVGKPLTDLVSISSAQFDRATGNLTINATSSDLSAPVPTLTAGIYGLMTSLGGGNYSLTVPALLLPTAEVTVTSSRGGQDIHPVTVIGAATAANPNAPIITTTALPNASVGSPYSFQVTALDNAGGAGLTFLPLVGAPPGLSISAAGLISGTVPAGTLPATFNVTITVQDPGLLTGSVTLPLIVTSFVITSPVPPPPFLLGVPYGPFAVTTVGGTGPFTYALTGLPGVGIGATGVITGTPTTVGPFTATITVTAAGGLVATQLFSGTVTAPALTLNPIPSPQSATVGVPFNLTATATGGVGARTFLALTGAPAWMTINATTGAISGTPTAAGSFPLITVTVRDSAVPTPSQVSQSFSLNVAAPVETLAVSAAQVTVITAGTTWRWVAKGTSTLTTGNTITLRLGGATGTVVGSAVVQANGSWSLDVQRNFGTGNATAPGTAVSTFGTTLSFTWVRK